MNKNGQRIPLVPAPSSASAQEGVADGRELAGRYWCDLVALNAAIAFGSPSEATLHTRVMAAKEIRELAAGVLPSSPAFEPAAATGGDTRPDSNGGPV